MNFVRIDRVRYPIHPAIQIAHSGEKRSVRLVETVDDSLVGVFVRSLGMRVIGIVVLILEPMPSDAGAGLEQRQNKVLVKETSVVLGTSQPAPVRLGMPESSPLA